MPARQAQPADRAAFLGLPVPRAQPEFLETVARLRGMQPAPASRARVLELRCRAGANLVPLAERYPQASFLGIDESQPLVAAATAAAANCALGNVAFHEGSIVDVDSGLGPFDYIVLHSVYSRHDSQARGKLLAACRNLLAPQGVAYVDYPTYPGWQVHDTIRQLIAYDARRATTPERRIETARMVVEFLRIGLTENLPYDALVQTELAALAAQSDDALLNDYLNEAIQPIYFRQFVSQAANHGLELAGDGTLRYRRMDRLSAEDEARLAMVAPDPMRQEQYRDIVRNRSFRQTLLCHAGAVTRDTFTGEQLEPLYLEGTLRPRQGEIDFRPGAVVHFSGARGARLSTGNGLLKAALAHLATAWPAYVPYADLLATARRTVEAAGSAAVDAAEAEQCEQGLVECCLNQLIAVHSEAESFVREPSTMPATGQLTRVQAAAGEMVTNRRHEPVRLDPLERWLVARLDGHHTETQLIAEAVAALATGQLAIAKDGRRVDQTDDARSIFSAAVPAALARLAEAALLIA